MVIDDEPAFGQTVARVLRAYADVVVEPSAAGALERMRRGERFDLILCDVMMAAMTGPEFYDRLAAVVPEACTTVTFATGGMDSVVAKHVQATGRPCVQKPVPVDALRALVASPPFG